METTAALRLPEVLVDYAQHYPDVDMVLRTSTTERLLADVLDRKIEGAIVAGPIDHPELMQQKVGSEELVIVTEPWLRYPHGNRPPWLPSATEAKTAIFRSGCSYRERIERLLIRQGVTRIRRMEIGSLDGIMGCVRAGIAISLLPLSVATPLADAGKIAVHRLAPGEGLVDSVFVRRRDTFVSSALARFVETVAAHFAVDTEGAEAPRAST